MNTLTIGSLFSGFCGLDMAVEEVFDAKTAWVSDIDKGACKILAHRYPDVPNLGDITSIDWSTVEPVDIITGGSPCQDLSHAGKRAGMTDGTRSNLWVAMREAIAQLKPSIVIWENVRGAYSAAADSDLESDAGLLGGVRRRDGEPVLRALGRVLGDLSDLGYDASWHGLRAADIGAPHGRFRVFVVAHAAGYRWDQGWAESARFIGRLDAAECGDEDELTEVLLLPTPMVTDAKDARNATSGRTNPDSQHHGGTTLGDVAYLARFGQYDAGIARWEPIVGRPAPSPTEPTGRNGAHRLSPRFTEWMMGAPDGWITDVPGITRNEALKACGNGVVRQQAVAALRYMLAIEVAA